MNTNKECNVSLSDKNKFVSVKVLEIYFNAAHRATAP